MSLKENLKFENNVPVLNIPADFKPNDQLEIEIVEEGSGKVVQPGDTVKIHYHGWLLNGETFDSSYERGAEIEFPLNHLIQGWQIGLAGQKVGTKLFLIIPPELGYGSQDAGPIPGNSTLIFLIEIFDTHS